MHTGSEAIAAAAAVVVVDDVEVAIDPGICQPRSQAFSEQVIEGSPSIIHLSGAAFSRCSFD